MTRNKYKKNVVRISESDWKRLEAIRVKYRFRSIYEIMQYLVGAFLRVADPHNDTEIEPIPYEIEQMFDDLSDADRQFNYSKPKRAIPQYVKDENNGQKRLRFNEESD